MDVNIIVQVIAALLAGFRAEQQQGGARTDLQSEGRTPDTQKTYSKFQLAKLKGFSCMRMESSL
jgi:hypothetical protein